MAYPLDRLASLLVTGKKPAGRRYHRIPQSQTGEPIANLRGPMTNTQLRRGPAVRTRCLSPVRAFQREKVGGGGGESEAESSGSSASTHAGRGSSDGGDESSDDDDEPDSHSSMANPPSCRSSADQDQEISQR